MGTQQTTTASEGIEEDPYSSLAVQWVGEVLVATLAASLVNAFVFGAGGGGLGTYILIFLINLGAMCMIAMRLFHHVDTLVLKRIAENERVRNE